MTGRRCGLSRSMGTRVMTGRRRGLPMMMRRRRCDIARGHGVVNGNTARQRAGSTE